MLTIAAVRPVKRLLPLYYKNFMKVNVYTTVFHHHVFNGNLTEKKYQPTPRFQSSLSYSKGLNIFQRIKGKLFKTLSDKSKINIAGILVYEKLDESINFPEFMRFFNLPDTFQSWFLIVQLHVWMSIITASSDLNVTIFRNSIIETMWNDVEQRLEKLAVMKSSKRKKYLQELVAQFQAAMISYDEGILCNDATLAAAAWRTLFCFQHVDPQMLENIVIYIRKQLDHIESLNREQFVYRGVITLQPLNSIFSNIDGK